MRVAPAPEELIDRALGALGERFSMGVVLFDGTMEVIWASGATPMVLGWELEALVGRSVLELLHPDDLERVMPMLEPALEDPIEALSRSASVRTAELSVRVASQDGGWRTVLVAGRVIDLNGNLVVTVRPGEERVAFDRVLQLLGEGERLYTTLDAVLDVVRAHFDQPACIVHAYDGALTIGGQREALVLDDARELWSGLRSGRGGEPAVDAHRWVFPVLSRRQDTVLGAIVLPVPWVELPSPYDVAIMERITGLAALAFERAMYDRRLSRDAAIDHLTGVLNRRSFERELASMSVSTDHPVVVLFADLDGFKEINDLYGHAVGDVVLESVAARLTSSVRGIDVVGRMGGDEFVVACPGLGADGLDELSTRVRSAVEGRVVTGDATVAVRLSLGVAVATDPAGLATVIERSDSAMYRDKRSRRRPELAVAQPPVGG